MRPYFRLITLCALVLLMAAPMWAQGTNSTLAGTVTTGGNPLPGATVTASSPALLGTRTTVTGTNGDFNIPALPPGDYTITIQLEGMQTVTRKTRLSLAETSRGDADLKLASVTEAITVTASWSPDTTTDDGPFTAAMPTPSVSCGRTSASVACRNGKIAGLPM